MSTIIKFELKELKKLTNDKNSCVIEKNVNQNLALQPWCLGNFKESITNLLDYKIGKFDKELNGILLSYKNLRVLQNVGTIRNDHADIHFQVQADYFIFQPYVGATLRGIVNKKSLSHLGIIVHRVFNVVIPRPTEEPGNKWVGESVLEGQVVYFRIVVVDLYGAMPYIRGELDERSLRLLPDGDDDEEAKQQDSVNVSYVNFDKTKPYTQKQIGDGLSQTIKSKVLKNNGKHDHSKPLIKHTTPTNGKSSKEKVTEHKSNSKIKKITKVEEVQDLTPKLAKKHKRDL